MKILFLTDNFPPERNAPASRTYEHTVRWAGRGEDVTVVTGVPNFPEGKIHPGYRNRLYQTEQRDGVRVVRVWTYVTANEGFLKRTLDYASFLASGAAGALAQTRPDVVVATSPQFFTAVAGCLVAAAWRVPFVFEVRDLWPDSIRAVGALRESRALRALERLELFLYRRAARIVVVTEAYRDNLLARGVPAAKIEVVPNGVDLGRFGPQPKDRAVLDRHSLNGDFIVSYIGTHGLAHRLETVLDAAKGMREEPVTFLLIGSGARKRELVEHATRERLRNVRFVDSRPREEMPSYWSISDATIVPLRRDPLFRTTVPSKMFEAMGMGIPILLGVEGEARRLVEEADAGIAFPPEDSEQLMSAIRRLMADGPLRERLRANALAASRRYSRDTTADTMLRGLQRIARVPVMAEVAAPSGSPVPSGDRGMVL
jgi:glycosyltransferase involved in cell wall biosynthesis